MRMTLVYASIAIVMASGPAQADEQKVAPPEKKICRVIEKTGSIMPGRRQCHTRSEWAAIDSMNSDNAQRAGDRNRSGMMPARPNQ